MAFGTVHCQIFPEGQLRDLSQIGNVVGDGEQLFIGQGTVALRKTGASRCCAESSHVAEKWYTRLVPAVQAIKETAGEAQQPPR